MSVGDIHVTVQGRVGSEVEFKDAATSRVALASFRLASTPRYYDRGENRWADRPTTWFTVECWRTLAENVKGSLQRGQPVTVTGRLKTTEWTDDQGLTKNRTVLDAFTVGHDLARGTAAFRKNEPLQVQSSPSLDEDMRGLSERAEATEQITEAPDASGEATAAPDEAADGSVPIGLSGQRTGPGREAEAATGKSRRAA